MSTFVNKPGYGGTDEQRATITNWLKANSEFTQEQIENQAAAWEKEFDMDSHQIHHIISWCVMKETVNQYLTDQKKS
jgi:hypothetical protein